MTDDKIKAYNDDLLQRYFSDEITLDELLDSMLVDPNSTEATPDLDFNIDDLFGEIDIFDDNVEEEKPKEEEEKIAFPTTQTIKGNIINLNYVESIEKIDKEHSNNITYGVKFNFTGKKKFYRIVWFNTNITQRDIVYEKQTKYLNQLKNTTH